MLMCTLRLLETFDISGFLLPIFGLCMFKLSFLHDPEDRQPWCTGVMISTSSLDAIFYNTFLTALVFRFLMVRYADRGLVVKANINLMLFNQIYWTCFGAFISIGVFYPFSLILQGKLDDTKPCVNLLIEETNKPSLYIAGYAMPALAFVLTQGLTVRLYRYIDGICPAKKMSAIGKFRRNIICYETNRMCLNIIISKLIVYSIIYTFAKVYPTIFPPKLVFWFICCYFTLRLIIFYTSIAYIPLTMEEVPQCKIKSFYVRKPIPEPKRDYAGDCTKIYISLKHINPHGAKVKQLTKFHRTTTLPTVLQVQPQPSGPILVRQRKHSSMPIVD